MDPVEIEFLCTQLDRARVRSPLIDIKWLDGWRKGMVSEADVIEASEALDRERGD